MKIAVISGSKSDQLVVNEVVKVLKKFGIEYEERVLSAHRNREELERYVKNCNADVFIGVAGLSAALPGFIASITTKPVIGVPVSVKLSGFDALVSIAQMPPRVPVACVGIDNGINAALLAIEILATCSNELKKKLDEYRRGV